MDAETRIEAGVLNEMTLASDREFLIRLPSLMREARDRDTLLSQLKKIYPDILVEDLGRDLCWGVLRLEFASHTELTGVSEGCAKR